METEFLALGPPAEAFLRAAAAAGTARSTGCHGYHPQLATCAQTGQVLMCRLRGGSAGAARGAKTS